ncbi:MAG: DUF975 family protein [Ruminococcus sp.]|nr:DUF975 family protein [Ruminococcus sp.]
MFDRKKAKKAARQTVRSHYTVLLFICLMAAFVGIKYESSLSFLGLASSVTVTDSEISTTVSPTDTVNLLSELLSGNIGISKVDKDVENRIEQSKENYKENKNKSFKLGNIEVSYAEGEFAKIANALSTGSYSSTVYSGIKTLTGSGKAATVIFTIASMLVKLVLTYFVFNVLHAVMSRIFLEARTYEKIPVKSFFTLLRTRKWNKAAIILLVKEVYLALWSFTIIGGIIKSYSYAMVPYLTAENPNLGANETITLSRKLMNGHKWECFKLDLSLIGWNILGLVTFGITDVFWASPYTEACYAELYACLRSEALAGEKRSEVFFDRYLFEKASHDALTREYGDVEELKARTEAFTDHFTGFREVLANVFGIVLAYSEKTEAIDRNEIDKIKVRQSLDEMEGRAYPERLAPEPPAPKRDRLSEIYYTRSYSLISLVLMFFIGSFIGWAWEVVYKYIEIGKLVNRGVMHGPWLPIYGSGGVMILIILKKLRYKPVLEFFSAIVLCGIVEYFTAYILETTHGGQKWWDYSGYFLNIDGRVCAEGLMVFGIGGVAFVYFAALMIDNHLRKLRMRIAAPVCAALILLFVSDFIYSRFNPNQGAGITDYQTSSSQVQKE